MFLKLLKIPEIKSKIENLGKFSENFPKIDGVAVYQNTNECFRKFN